MGRLREIVPLAALVAVTFRKTSDTKTSSNKNHQKSSNNHQKKQPNRNNPTKITLERIPDEVMQLQGSLPRPAQALKAQGAGRLGRSQLLC